jgi:hypothetical protein
MGHSKCVHYVRRPTAIDPDSYAYSYGFKTPLMQNRQSMSYRD